MSTRQFVLVRPVVALLLSCWADTSVCPYCGCFFVVFVGANRCVRPCCCVALFLLGRHAGLPLRCWCFLSLL